MKIAATRKLSSLFSLSSSFIPYRALLLSTTTTNNIGLISAAYSSSTSSSTSSSLNMSMNAMKATTPTTMKTKVRIVSYNVLSSQLSEPEHFSTLNPDHLNPINRLPIVLQKLDQEIHQIQKKKNVPNENGQGKQLQSPIICLQEVSHDWAGSLHTYFANQGYYFITGLYGKKFNGYMGVGIAFKPSDYNVLDVDISRLADQREGGWPRPVKQEPSTSIVGRVKRSVWKVYQGMTKSVSSMMQSFLLTFWPGYKKPRSPIEPWSMSENRHNQLVTLTLQDKNTHQSFVIGNYHMPCAFYAPMVMSIHSDLAARHIQRLAGVAGATGSVLDTTTTDTCTTSKKINNNENNDDDDETTITTNNMSSSGSGSTTGSLPYILAGDWNIKPGDSSYRLLTTGKMDKGAPEWPTPKFGSEWAPTATGMRSAYAVASHDGKTEPDFTNYARVKEEEPFIDTLDYLFLSDEWQVTQVKDLPHRNEVQGPFPNLDPTVNEPSDHILISADLEL